MWKRLMNNKTINKQMSIFCNTHTAYKLLPPFQIIGRFNFSSMVFMALPRRRQGDAKASKRAPNRGVPPATTFRSMASPRAGRRRQGVRADATQAEGDVRGKKMGVSDLRAHGKRGIARAGRERGCGRAGNRARGKEEGLRAGGKSRARAGNCALPRILPRAGPLQCESTEERD